MEKPVGTESVFEKPEIISKSASFRWGDTFRAFVHEQHCGIFAEILGSGA